MLIKMIKEHLYDFKKWPLKETSKKPSLKIGENKSYCSLCSLTQLFSPILPSSSVLISPPLSPMPEFFLGSLGLISYSMYGKWVSYWVIALDWDMLLVTH